MNKELRNCPFCNKCMDSNDRDTLYQTGTIYLESESGDIIYFSRQYDKYVELIQRSDVGFVYTIVCQESQNGCGASINGLSMDDVIDKWNQRY